MPNRRKFLKDVGAATGLMFVGCGLADAAAQAGRSSAPAKHRPVMIKGRRIRVVDIHTHCVVTQALTLLKRQVNRQAEHPLEGQPLAKRLEVMDAQGIDVAVLSVNPNWYDVDRDLATEVIR